MQPHQQAGTPPQWPEPKRPERMLFPLSSVIAASAGLVFLTVVLFFIVSTPGCACIDGPTEPIVQMSIADHVDKGAWRAEVAGVSEARELHSFRAILVKNGAQIDAVDLLTAPSRHFGFVDLDGAGTLTAADYFTIECDPASSYNLVIIWKDSGNVRGSIDWET